MDFQVEAEFPAFGLADVQWIVLDEPLPGGTLVVVNASRALPEGAYVTPVIAAAVSRADDGPASAGPAEPEG